MVSPKIKVLCSELCPKLYS